MYVTPAITSGANAIDAFAVTDSVAAAQTASRFESSHAPTVEVTVRSLPEQAPASTTNDQTKFRMVAHGAMTTPTADSSHRTPAACAGEAVLPDDVHAVVCLRGR